MLPKQIVALFVRLFSIVFLIMALRSAASFVPYLESYGAGFPVAIVVLTSMVPFLFFCATWFFPATIAGWLVGSATSSQSESRWSNDDIWTTAFIFVGLVWLYWALSDALYWAIFYFVSTPDQGWRGLGPDGQASILTTIVELILAVSLILGAGGWKSILFKLRYGSSAGPTPKDTA